MVHTLGLNQSMTLKQKLSILLPLLFIVVLLSIVFAPSASAQSQVVIPSSAQDPVEKALKDVSTTKYDTVDGGSANGNTIFKMDKGGVFVFNTTEFETLTSSSQQKALQDYLTAMDSHEVSKQARRDIEKTIQQGSSEANRLMIPLTLNMAAADMSGGYSLISGAMPLVKVIFGVMVYILIIGLIISTLLDFAYMGLPLARNIGGQGGDKPAWISTDAYVSVKEAEGGEKASNVYLKYLIKRSWTYILFTLAVTWLALGNIGDFIAAIMTLGDGFMNL